MSFKPSVYVLVATADSRRTIAALSVLLPQLERHVFAVEVCCPRVDVGVAKEALCELAAQWPAGPPLQMQTDARLGPGLRVLGLPDAMEALCAVMHERVRTLTTPGVAGVALYGVSGLDYRLPQLGLHLAMTQFARPEDQFARIGDGLRPLSFVRSQALDTPDHTRDLVAKSTFSELCRLTEVPSSRELRATLQRHLRGWTYAVFHGTRAVASVTLSGILGMGLAAVIRAPSASVHGLFEQACAEDLGWSPAYRGDVGDPERVDARVRVWLTRLRKKLAPWRAQGLQDFIPEARTRRLVGRVDIQFDADLPWRSNTP